MADPNVWVIVPRVHGERVLLSQDLTLLRSLNAERGQFHLDFEESGRPRLSRDKPATLQEVVVRAEGGLEFAPLELKVPVVEVLFGARTLLSEDDVVVIGRGLRADGKGLFADALSGLMRLELEPVVLLELADGTQARLQAGGPLTFQNRPDRGPEWVEVRAAGGAVLVLLGADPVQVDAEELRLFGILRESDDRFLPRFVEAEGQVVVRRGESTFFGDRGEVTFGDDGRPASGELRGSPRAEVVMQGVGIEGRQRVEDPGASMPVRARGRELLEFELGISSRFTLDGPAAVHLPSVDTTLEAQGRIRGGRESSGGYDTVTAEGGVVVTSPNENLVDHFRVLARSSAPLMDQRLAHGVPAGLQGVDDVFVPADHDRQTRLFRTDIAARDGRVNGMHATGLGGFVNFDRK